MRKTTVVKQAFNFIKANKLANAAAVATAINKDVQYTAKMLYGMERRGQLQKIKVDGVHILYAAAKDAKFNKPKTTAKKRVVKKPQNAVVVPLSVQQAISVLQNYIAQNTKA